jgi:hypothetical protein
LCPLNLAGTETTSADPQLYGLAVYTGPDRLQIGFPNLFGTDMRMADLHTNGFSFAANIALKRHELHLL